MRGLNYIRLMPEEGFKKLTAYVRCISENPSYIPRIIYKLPRNCLFKRKGYSEITLVEVELVVWRTVILLGVL